MKPSVRVAVLTYRRPDDIAAAIPRLVAEAVTATADGWDVDVLVIDNDADASARKVVTQAAASSAVPVGYVVEPVSGIAAARNRALTESSERDLLVFIDDDERPVERWLSLLLDAHQAYGGAVVGPVVSQFDSEPDSWISSGGFFTRRRMATGSPVVVAATNNLLLDLREIRSFELEFDLDFGLSGGSDTLFTRELVARGGRMTWCDEAVVYDIVPASRTTRRWVLLRALRSGTSWSATSLRVAKGSGQRLRWQLRDFGSGIARVAGGAARWVVGFATRNEGLRARGARNLARGAGLAAGVFGYRYQEYKRT
ncbi:glycosyltransferase family 2 protein [Micropruina sp.]|uniref:glycosyltransferase family 2 protein n=1 Tax=Micropruina sp. TaxID=2737536 RepID=UPI0039E2F59E